MDSDVRAMEPNNERTWIKSTFSGDANCCVEVSVGSHEILVRDSKFRRQAANDPAAEPVLAYTRDEWEAFIEGVKAGEFDLESAS